MMGAWSYDFRRETERGFCVLKGIAGGTTDRNSLSARQADGAACVWAMLVEVDAAVVKLLLVRFVAEGREVIRSLPVRKEVEQPQKLAVNAPRGRHACTQAETPATDRAYGSR